MTFPIGKRLLLHFSKLPHMLRTGGKPIVNKSTRMNPCCFQSHPLGILSEMLSRNLVGSYEDKYIKWSMLRQGRGQDVPEFTNVVHTLHRKLGIKDTEQHLVLKYRDCLHKYIQDEMEFLDISSLDPAYRYAVKIEQKFK